MRCAAVIACTADFTTGAAAILRGLQRHHPAVARICFTTAEETEAVQAILGDLAEVRPMPRKIKNAPDLAKFQVSWSRVFLPTIDAEVVAWFDADVVLCRPAPEWWQVPPGKINVVADRAYRIKHMIPDGMAEWFFGKFPLDPEARGFNNGIFSLRPGDHADFAERFEAALAEQNPDNLPVAFDQALMNGLFDHCANLLPVEFNATCIAECGVPREVRAVHYTGSPKPWAAGYDHASDGYYRWLRYGACIDDPRRLLAVKLRAIASRPRRLAYKALRKGLTKLGLWNHEMGIGRRPDAAKEL